MNIQKKLLQHIKYMRTYTVVTVMLALLTAGLIVAQAQSIARVINAAFLSRQGLSSIMWLLGVLLAVILVRAILVWIGERISNHTATIVKSELRRRVFAHLFALGPRYTRGERSGELVNTLSEGIETLDAYFSQFFPQVCAAVVIPLCILGIAFVIDPLSGLILLLTLPLLPFFMILIGKQANAMTQRRWHLLSQMSAHFLDVLQGLTTLKLFGRSGVQRENVRKVSAQFGAMTMKVLRVAFLSSFVMEMGATISTALVAVEIGLRLLYGGIGFEQAFFILLLAPEFYLPLRGLGPQFHAAMASMAGGQRLFEILETPAQGRGAGADGHAELVPTGLRFQDITFSYSSDTAPALTDVSFEVQAGQRVAIVGPSGAGKSTLANLLLRFVEPQQGEIRVMGEDGAEVALQHIPVKAWRELVAWQPQRPSLFTLTAAENIRLGRPEASMDEVIEAARQAHIHEVIEALPQGYETLIGEHGARLSGGEAQRLSLARAFIKNAPILLLDEATSTLDSASEAYVQRAIDAFAQERITLMIAHRLHTVRAADRIIVLDKGRVADCGTHDELLARSPLYQALIHAYEGVEVGV